MTFYALIRRSLTYYWRTNLAVVAGVAIAVSVLAGAALVGQSVRASLRDLFLNRLGATRSALTGSGFFREQLAASFPSAVPLIAMEGVVIADRGRASNVAVYGVDPRFWKFHGRAANPPGAREILLSPDLAREIGAAAGDSILIRMPKPSAIPAEWLHGRKDETGRAIRLTMREVLPRDALGEFSLRAQQGPVRAAFVALERLQRDLDLAGKANTILLGEADGEAALRESFALADLGIRLRPIEGGISIESDAALVSDTVAAAVAKLGVPAEPVFTYLANTIRVGDREIPYSLAAGMGGDSVALNEWAARDLDAKPGDPVTLEYYLWKDEGRLATESVTLPLGRIVPLRDRRDLAPDYPGMTDSESLHDWDPPFPVDLKRVRPRDEEYWKQYRTTPKAFLPLETAQKLWGSRFGKLTSIRVAPAPPDLEQRLRGAIDPVQAGLSILPVRAQGLAAAQGSTDFGEYFTYFSFFLVIAALVLAGLFFRLGIEQRLREIGALRALGFSGGRIAALFLAEGGALAAIGSLLGIAGAAGYAALVLLGLRTFWVDAVGTRLLTLHVSPASLAAGAGAGIAAALISIALSVRKLRKLSPLRLLSGGGYLVARPSRKYTGAAILAALAAGGLLAGAVSGSVNATASFFGAGALLLAAALLFEWSWLAGARRSLPRSVPRLGFRNAGYRPGRSILCIALVAMATFLVVAIDAFRRPAGPFTGDPKSGDGGFPLLAESILPVVYDPNSDAGRENLNLTEIAGRARIVRFRLRPGEDVSCLNLYQPRNPRILGAPAEFLREDRFSFLGGGPNPWLLLEAPAHDGAIPAIVDANTLQYSLHLKVGDVFQSGPVKLRIVAALRDSIFQSEFLISEQNFIRAFPDEEGYRFFLIDAEPGDVAQVAKALEDSLSDYGFDAAPAPDRLASYHRVENTYLSTFQTLGTLGLILGTAGLAAVMLRNILERRRELALLQAMGYNTSDLAIMVMSESLFLLFSGLGMGTACALLAIAPAFTARGGQFSAGSLALLLAGVLLSGSFASLIAMRAVAREPLLSALRAE